MTVHLPGPMPTAEVQRRLRGYSGKFYVWYLGIDWCRVVERRNGFGAWLRGTLLWLRLGRPKTAAEAAEALR